MATPVAMIAANGEHAGKVVWSALYDPWGNLLQETHIDPENPIEQTIRFQGQHFDQESGLHYNRHRYYDPQIGTYITQDPIGILGDENFYVYPSNPIAFVDPLGLKEEKPGMLKRIWNWCTGAKDAKETKDAYDEGRKIGLDACAAQKEMEKLKQLDEDPVKALQQLEGITERRAQAVRSATQRLGKQATEFGKDSIPTGKTEPKDFAKLAAFSKGIDDGMKDSGCKK